MKRNSIKDFTGFFQLSKTLCFEAEPEGRTKEYLREIGFDSDKEQASNDELRAANYVNLKKIMDKYHKTFIKEVLGKLLLQVENSGKGNSLEEFLECYQKTNKEEGKKNLKKIQAALREQIASAFNKDSRWNRIFKTELITEDLPKFVETEEERKLIKEFERFTTYLNEYHNNRKNIYSVKEKSTAIAYRIVNENLPRFIDNGKVMEKLFEIPELQDNFRQLQADLDSELCGKDIKVLFDLSHFNDFLSQEGIELYNTIIGGKAEEGKTIKIKGINEYINQYNQQCEGKLPKLKMLLKQILSDRNVISWLPKQFEDDNELLKSLEQCYQEITNRVLICKGERDLSHLLASIKEPNTNLYQIFLTNDKHLNEISAKVFGSWDVIQTAILSTTIERKPRERENKYEERKKKYWESHAYFSIGFINECLLRSGVTVTGSLVEYFVKIGKDRDTGKNLIDEVKESYGKVKNLLSTPYSAEKRLIDDEDNVLNIKKLLDSLKALQYFIKPLAGSDDESQKDERFYGEFEAMWQTLHCVTFLYDKARNYLTCKPYSAKKIKLNFENPTLLNGWDSDKEKDYSCFMLRKEKDYFLGIFENKNKRNIDFNNKSPQNNEGYYEKMRYKKVAKPEQDIFNLMVIDGKTQKKNGRKEKEGENIGKNIRLEELKNKYLPDNINRIRKSGSYLRSNASFKKQDLIDFIDYYKERVIEYNKELLFNFKASSEYNTFDDFTNHVKQQGYSLTFSCISEKYINSLVDEGEVYLFKIRNKDLSGNSKGTPNLHTIYWKMLFDKQNLDNVVYRLNGEAEIFFRKKSIHNSNPTHPAGVPIKKKLSLGTRTLKYDLIKDKRYTEDKFLLHIPITLNFKCSNQKKVDINSEVNQYLHDADNVHIIGIDRGERHLLYLSLIDMQGKIVKQFSLNEIVNHYNEKSYKINYHELLVKREKECEDACAVWRNFKSIKELKEGYMSQVVHIISKLMVEYNAIVVLEDLNQEFMRGRQKVKAQVYQKFERSLIEKLNYLVDKKSVYDAPMGALRALQLTNKYENLSKKDMSKQSGFLFYVPAWNTSKIDPVTGFVNLFNAHHFNYENKNKSKDFFRKFNSIRYNAEKDWFEFAFDYNQFEIAQAEGTRGDWTICTYGERIEVSGNKNDGWNSKKVNLTERFKSLFSEYCIDWTGDIKAEIIRQDKVEFFKELLKLFKLTLQMRNSKPGTEIDYLISPVFNGTDVPYCSNNHKKGLPDNADANGAYNIALKGLWMIRQIKEANNLSNVNLVIKNREWLNFAQTKPYLQR